MYMFTSICSPVEIPNGAIGVHYDAFPPTRLSTGGVIAVRRADALHFVYRIFDVFPAGHGLGICSIAQVVES